MADTLRDLGVTGDICTERHDEVARKIAAIDKLPPTPENQTARAELYALQAGLNAGVEYCRGIREMHGKTR
jgi:hypothetical protein